MDGRIDWRGEQGHRDGLSRMSLRCTYPVRTEVKVFYFVLGGRTGAEGKTTGSRS